MAKTKKKRKKRKSRRRENFQVQGNPTQRDLTQADLGNEVTNSSFPSVAPASAAESQSAPDPSAITDETVWLCGGVDDDLYVMNQDVFGLAIEGSFHSNRFREIHSKKEVIVMCLTPAGWGWRGRSPGDGHRRTRRTIMGVAWRKQLKRETTTGKPGLRRNQRFEKNRENCCPNARISCSFLLPASAPLLLSPEA